MNMNTQNNEIENLKAMADPTRLRLLSLLTAGELCVCDLTDTLRLPQSTVSRHMSRLRAAGLVIVQQRAKWHYYMLSNDTAKGWGQLRAFIERLVTDEPYRSDRLRLQRLLSAKGTGDRPACAKPQIKD